MKKLIIIMVILLGIQGISMGQNKTKRYILSGGEIMFSFATLDSRYDKIPRFSPVFNFQSWHVYDFGGVGLFHGLSLRNVGFIAEDRSINTKIKYRTYNLGIPVGVILQLSPDLGFFGGYELELPFNYKQKTFVNEEKVNKFNVWFSERHPTLAHGVYGGFQFRSGVNLKFKYYLNSFFNQNYREVDADGIESFPYRDIDAHVFYFSISFNVFKGRKVIIHEVWRDES